MTTFTAITSATSATATNSTIPLTEVHDHEETAPVVVYTCGRLGRTANPPRFAMTDWFRFGRRR